MDFGDYSLPPDCLADPDVDTDLYSEPADSLNQPNSSRLLPGSNRSIPLRDDVFSSTNAGLSLFLPPVVSCWHEQ